MLLIECDSCPERVVTRDQAHFTEPHSALHCSCHVESPGPIHITLLEMPAPLTPED